MISIDYRIDTKTPQIPQIPSPKAFETRLLHDTMLSFIFLVNFLIINATFCLQQNHEETYKFFKASTDLPGPTMSFNISKGFGVFQFQFQTSIARALLLYRDDFGERDFMRFVNGDIRDCSFFRVRNVIFIFALVFS